MCMYAITAPPTYTYNTHHHHPQPNTHQALAQLRSSSRATGALTQRLHLLRSKLLLKAHGKAAAVLLWCGVVRCHDDASVSGRWEDDCAISNNSISAEGGGSSKGSTGRQYRQAVQAVQAVQSGSTGSTGNTGR
jgi:hypothetical protein